MQMLWMVQSTIIGIKWFWRCDAVVHLRNGAYGFNYEIKLGGEKLIEDGAKTLTALTNISDTSPNEGTCFLYGTNWCRRFCL